MSLPGADVLEKLKGVAISRRDRDLLYRSIIGTAAAIVALIVLLAVLAWYGKDGKNLAAIADTLIWVAFGLIVVFVAGTVENRRVAARTMAPPAAPTPAASPPAAPATATATLTVTPAAPSAPAPQPPPALSPHTGPQLPKPK